MYKAHANIRSPLQFNHRLLRPCPAMPFRRPWSCGSDEPDHLQGRACEPQTIWTSIYFDSEVICLFPRAQKPKKTVQTA